jgi:hypothetical protein
MVIRFVQISLLLLLLPIGALASQDKATNESVCVGQGDPWILAAKGNSKEPNTCQILLAFDELVTELWRTSWSTPSDCSALHEEGCTFGGNGMTFEVRLVRFARIGCRGPNHECDYSFGFTCKARLAGFATPETEAIWCGGVGALPSGTQTAKLVASSNRHWKIDTSSGLKGRPLEGSLQDIRVLCPQVIKTVNCPRPSPSN